MAKYQICNKGLTPCGESEKKFSIRFVFSVLNTETNKWSSKENVMFFGPFTKGNVTVADVEEYWFQFFLSDKKFGMYFKDQSLVEPYVKKDSAKNPLDEEEASGDALLAIFRQGGDNNNA